MEGPEDSASTRLVFDCFSALLLLLTALLGAYLPRYLSARGGQQSGTATSLAFHLGNMLSGGVMLSAGFCHLLADALRQLAFVGRFPMAPFLAAVGYLITLLADQIVQVLTADSADPGTSASSNQHSYTRLDKQLGSGDAIEMIAPGSSWNGVLPSSRISGLEDHGSVISRSSAWGSSGGVLLEPVAPSRQETKVRGSTPGAIAEGVSGRAVCSRLTGPDGSMGLGKLSVRLPDAAAAAAAAAGGGFHSSSRGVSDAGVAADMALCVTATGSPRAITAGNIMSRSAGSSRGGAAAAAGSASTTSSNSSRAHVERSIGGGAAAAAAVDGGGGCNNPVANGCLTWVLTDDAAISHPATPDPLQQQMQPHKAGEKDLLGIGDVLLQQQQQQQQREERDHEQKELLGQHNVDSAAYTDDSTAPPLPCSQLLVSPTAAVQAQQQQGRMLHSGILTHHVQQQCCNGSTSQVQHLQEHWQASSSYVDEALLEASAEPHHHPTGSSYCKRMQHCCCCRSGKGMCCCTGSSTVLRSGSMTEACTVARVAEHLELEITSPAGSGGPHNHAHFQVFLAHQPLSFATTVLLACALCIHSVLEGVALGAQQTMEATQDIMLAIAAHKGLAAYALGASIVESKASAAKFWTVIAMFASATPIGIAIGYASSHIGHGNAGAAMSALASGTFLYVALNEVIPKELEHPDGHRLLKVAALLLGFGLMSLLAVWA